MKRYMIVTTESQAYDEAGEQYRYVIKPEDVEHRIAAYDNTIILFKNVEVTDENMEKIEQIIDSQDDVSLCASDVDDLEELLKSTFPEITVEYTGDTPTPFECIVWDSCSGDFSDFSDWETQPMYQYFDGSNYRDMWIDDMQELQISNYDYCLDEWDGQNMSSGDRFEHEYVHKVYSIDNEKVEDQFLLWHASQWQGSQDTGKILSRNGIIDHIEELGDRDIEHYMEKIDSLDIDLVAVKEL